MIQWILGQSPFGGLPGFVRAVSFPENHDPQVPRVVVGGLIGQGLLHKALCPGPVLFPQGNLCQTCPGRRAVSRTQHRHCVAIFGGRQLAALLGR